MNGSPFPKWAVPAVFSSILVSLSGNPSSGGAAHNRLCGAIGGAEMVSFDYLFWIFILSAVAVQRPNMVMPVTCPLSFIRKEMDLVYECLFMCVYTCPCMCAATYVCPL